MTLKEVGKYLHDNPEHKLTVQGEIQDYMGLIATVTDDKGQVISRSTHPSYDVLHALEALDPPDREES